MNYKKKYLTLIIIAQLFYGSYCVEAQTNNNTGIYFSRQEYKKAVLPSWKNTQKLLPQPVYEEDSLLVKTYWKAWELAFHNFYEPAKGSGFVSPFIDAAFNNNVFLWDACFMSLFCNYGYPLVPGISSLDNFYAKQHASGEICREIERASGKDCDFWVNHENKNLFSRWGYQVPEHIAACDIIYKGRQVPSPAPDLTLDGMNHPLLAWAEWESFIMTGDTGRLKMVWKPLVKYYEVFQKYIRQGNGLYMTDWASMDNSQRNPALKAGGTGIDVSSEMVLFAKKMSQIATVLGLENESKFYEEQATQLSAIINRLMWDPVKQFYEDVTVDGKLTGIKTIAAYWTLLAGVAGYQQASALAAQLSNPATFGRLNPVPTLAADEKEYASFGNYWRGSVWAPTNTVVIKGLEQYGYSNLARTIAMKHLNLVAEVLKKTGTIWENYAPDTASFGLHADGSPVVKDFVGWSGIAPIAYFFEYAIGLKADATHNEITWNIYSHKKVGCRRFRFNNREVSLVAYPSTKGKTLIQVSCTKEFNLKIKIGEAEHYFKIKSGKCRLLI